MFTPHRESLDPDLFGEGEKMDSSVRKTLLDLYHSTMGKKYANPQEWSHVWLAGSGASYQWQEGQNADMDMLVGVDYPQFRFHNPNLRGLTDNEISWVLNQYMRDKLHQTWGRYDQTWYNNPEDVRKLNPYAAYSLTDDDWHVRPSLSEIPQYDPGAYADSTRAQDVLNRYTRARNALQRRDLRPEVRKAHARALSQSLEHGHALFEEIHNNRRQAFLPGGKGYNDPANVRWQTGKASGVVPAMRAMSDLYTKQISEQQLAQYGMTFPDVNELVIRSMLQDDR
jgi:hypothetical protein